MNEANSGPTVEPIIRPVVNHSSGGNEANSGPTVKLIIRPATNEANVGRTVKPIFHPATNEANVGPTVEPIVCPATNKANVRPTVEPIFQPSMNEANVGPTVEPIFLPATNESNVGPTDTGYPDIFKLFNKNTLISMLQFSPYANNDDFEESFEDEDNGTVVPETQMNNLESDDNNQKMLDEGCMICKRDDYRDKSLLWEGCKGGYHTCCLHPPLHLVPECDFCCEKCKEAGKDDRMLELIKTRPNCKKLHGLREVRDMDIGQQ